MQVVEKSEEGLSRVYGVTVPAKELDERLTARIAEITPGLNLRGFRPGKVPPAHIRRVYGRALMGEVVEKTLTETAQKVVEDRGLRPAAEPDLKPQSDMEQVLAGKEDLAFEVAVEVIPDFEPMDFSAIPLTRVAHSASEAEIETELSRLAESNRTFAAREGKPAKAETGDQLLVDFVGEIDGAAFEGGSATDAEIVLGSGAFLPGFEEQLQGAKAGETRTVEISFPEGYPVERLKGRQAQFKVEVKEVRAPSTARVDDELAKRLGLDDLAALKEAIRADLQRSFDQMSRFKLKRALLDVLDEGHAMELPQGMVAAEFDGIWRQVEHEREHGHASDEDAGKSEEELRAEYHNIAERRVRLGLVLAEIGRRENVTVTEQELAGAMRAEAARHGPRAREMFDMLRQSPQAQMQLRAPLYEDKVVDLIIEKAKVADREVSRDELLAEDELPEGYGGAEAKPGKAGKARKAKAAKSAPADAEPTRAKVAKPAKAKVAKPAEVAEEPAKTKAANPPEAAEEPAKAARPRARKTPAAKA